MAPEIRNWREGTLRWVEASGTGLGWQTASAVPTAQDTAQWAAISGLLGFVQAGQSFAFNQNWATVHNRGVPDHHKLVDTPEVEMRFTVLAGVTGDYPTGNTAIGPSALGFSQPPRWNLEFKTLASEIGGATGLFYQLHKAVIISKSYTEQPEGNTLEFAVRALSGVGPTGSGYLS